MKPIIEVNNLYKQYRIGEEQSYYSFRDTLVDLVKLPLKRKTKKEDFWALRDVTFKVMPGEVIGVIGRNGAGKSTLLKILSRITPPTKGEITLRGRVASLLEVGTGFSSELTGRENIYLNGAILGMKRIEINNKFDQIVEFSEISKFLDTPVKHYSSGMYMRLAFAIAAHLDPEILLVDEVLAVGDTEFQKKCLGKMNEVAKSGRTILFVSHNMNAISRLCNKAIYIKNGSVEFNGEVNHAIHLYNKSPFNTIEFASSVKNLHKKAFVKRFNFVCNQDKAHKSLQQIYTFAIEVQVRKDIPKLEVAMGINNELGHRITTLSMRFCNKSFNVKKGNYKVFCNVTNVILKPGIYYTDVFIGDRYEAYDYIQDPIMFSIGEPKNFYPSGVIPENIFGPILASQEWTMVQTKK